MSDFEDIARRRVSEALIDEREVHREPISVRLSGLDDTWDLVVTNGTRIGGIGRAGRVLVVSPGGPLMDPLAGLAWSVEHGKPFIHHVWVDPEARDQGLATKLVDAYRKNVSRKVVIAGPFSPGGRALAQSVGAKIMENPTPESPPKRYITVITPGDLMIVRTSSPGPKPRVLLKALTPLMREHGMKQKDLQLEFLASDAFEAELRAGQPKWARNEPLLPADQYYLKRNEDLLPKIRAAFDGDFERFGKFWLYDWQDDGFVLVRKPKADANPASDYRTEVLHLGSSGRGRYEQHNYVIQAFDPSGEVVGYMKMRLVQNVADVSYVEVAETMRRRGIAEAMYARLYQWADEENVYVKHRGMTPEGAATVTSLRERGVIPKRRKIANPGADDEWIAQYDAWEAERDRIRTEFIAQARARFARDRIVSVESYGDEVRFTSSLHKATRPGAAYQITDFEGDEPIGHHEYDGLDAALAGLWELASPRTKGVPPVPNPGERPAFKYRYLGTNDEESVCGCCGRQDLKRVAWLVALDEDGNEIGEPVAYGTTCAGQLLRDAYHDRSKKKPTKGQSEKLFEESRNESLREAWARALELPLPPMPAVTIGPARFGVPRDVVYIGDEQIRSVPEAWERIRIEDTIESAKREWTQDRRLDFAVEIAKQMGLHDVARYEIEKARTQRNPREDRLRSRIARA